MNKYVKIVIIIILVICPTVTSIIFINKAKTSESNIISLKKQLNSKDIEIKTLRNSVAKIKSTGTQTKKTTVDPSYKKLTVFFASKGIDIPLDSDEWIFFTSDSANAYGGPDSWKDHSVICVDKYDISKDKPVWEGLRYMYCPSMNKGAQIANYDNKTFMVHQIYN